MKKGWKIFWTVIISLTGAGCCILYQLRYVLESQFSQFEKAYRMELVL